MREGGTDLGEAEGSVLGRDPLRAHAAVSGGPCVHPWWGLLKPFRIIPC